MVIKGYLSYSFMCKKSGDTVRGAILKRYFRVISCGIENRPKQRIYVLSIKA